MLDTFAAQARIFGPSVRLPEPDFDAAGHVPKSNAQETRRLQATSRDPESMKKVRGQETVPSHIMDQGSESNFMFQGRGHHGRSTRCRVRRRLAVLVARPAGPPTPGTAVRPTAGIVILMLESPVLKSGRLNVQKSPSTLFPPVLPVGVVHPNDHSPVGACFSKNDVGVGPRGWQPQVAGRPRVADSGKDSGEVVSRTLAALQRLGRAGRIRPGRGPWRDRRYHP